MNISIINTFLKIQAILQMYFNKIQKKDKKLKNNSLVFKKIIIIVQNIQKSQF